ncbi:MAG: hypothetical protein ACK4HQ_03405 [Brevinematales bacterium]
MKIVLFLSYLFYKAAVILLLFFGLQRLSLRTELGVWIVYSFFSLAAFLVAVRHLLLKKISLFSRWTLWWLIVLEWLTIGMVGFYLWFFRESSAVRVIWIIASLAPLHLLVFDAWRLLVSRWNLHFLGNLQKPSWVFEYGLEIPCVASLGFFLWEGARRASPSLLWWGIGLVGWLMVRHYAVGWFWQKGIKRISQWLLKQNPLLFSHIPPIHDTNMLSPLLFAWQQYASRVKNTQKQFLWMNPVLSDEIQKKLASDGEIRFGIERPATVVALFWKLGETSPLQEYVFLDVLAKTTMEYIHQYDGFPFWEHEKLFVFFGFPYFYEHKNLWAIEFSQRILSEIKTIAQSQEIQLESSILILTEKVRIGAVPVFGEDFSQLVPQGKIFQRIDLVKRAAEGLKIPLLIDKRVLQGLEARFFIQKTYKIVVQNEALILCQVVD